MIGPPAAIHLGGQRPLDAALGQGDAFERDLTPAEQGRAPSVADLI